MKLRETGIADLLIIEPTIHRDTRGFFFESFNQFAFEKAIGRSISFVQDNRAFSTKGVLRGLHFQKPPFAQSKLVSVLNGCVYDVVVDLRPTSTTFGKSFGIELSSTNHLQLFVPKGFAHGYAVLSETADFFYKVDEYYTKEAESGIIWNDEDLEIDWKISPSEMCISAKDKLLPTFRQFKK